MAILQDTYSDDIEPGLPGMVANSETSTIVSRTITGVGQFGAPVVQSADDDHAVDPAGADDDEVHGILKRDTTLGAEREAYAADDTAAVVRQGVVWVRAGGAFAVRSPAFYNRATNRYFGAAAAGRTPVPGAFDDAATAADQPVRLRLNLPGNSDAA